MNTQIPKKQMRLFFHRISAEGCLGLGLALFALGIVFFTFQSSAVSATQGESEKGNAKRGQEVFEMRCTGCHSLDKDKEGPRLRGVYGKKAGRLSTTFKYSDALKASNVTWDAVSLDQWMADPEKIIPNSDNFFRVPEARERTHVIAYLQQLSDEDKPASAVEVKIDNFAFTPQTLTVSAGTQVTWINKDDIPHNIVDKDKTFKSKVLDTEEKFTYTFDKPGTYTYLCSIHPRMTGKVIVK
jgi:cytochrome c